MVGLQLWIYGFMDLWIYGIVLGRLVRAADRAFCLYLYLRASGHYWLMAFLLSDTTLSQLLVTRSDAQDTVTVMAKTHLNATIVR
jgi:hypothetical protein